jgi:hypothetical protein
MFTELVAVRVLIDAPLNSKEPVHDMQVPYWKPWHLSPQEFSFALATKPEGKTLRHFMNSSRVIVLTTIQHYVKFIKNLVTAILAALRLHADLVITADLMKHVYLNINVF